jgi:hypothetical protein
MRKDATAELLVFEPERIVLAVAFHLIDEAIASSVDPASRDAVTRCLAERSVRLALTRQRWAALDNGQRLRWLLAQAPIDVTLGADRTALLGTRGLPATKPGRATMTVTSQ